MKKQINITAADFDKMGWVIEDQDRETISHLVINNNQETRTVKAFGVASNGEVFEFSDYSFDYNETLEDLNDYGFLPNFISGQGQVVVNDHERKMSAIVPAGDVAEIIGDIDRDELAVYGSFEELNFDIDGFSFSHVYDEPEYEMNEANEF